MEIVKSLIEYHNMIPHPEGGHYVEVFKTKDVSHIYFLLKGHEHSHWHRITKTETVHFYSGDPLEIYTSKHGEEFDWELDEHHIQHLKDLGLYDEENPGEEFISRQ